MKLSNLVNLAPMAMRLREAIAVRDDTLERTKAAVEGAQFSFHGHTFYGDDAVAFYAGMYAAARMIAHVLEQDLLAAGVEPDELPAPPAPTEETPAADA